MKQLLLLCMCLSLFSCSIQEKTEPDTIIIEGEPGENGFNSLIRTSQVDNCLKLEYGLDLDRNNILSDSEVSNTELLCSVDGNNGINSLVEIYKEGQCITVSSGLDTNENGNLDQTEITSQETICATEGEDGLNSLIKIKDIEEGEVCEFGGFYVYVGLDDNRNGILDNDEIDDETLVCSIKCYHDPECEYIIVNTEHCEKDKSYVLWMNGNNRSNEYFKNVDLVFDQEENGNATLKGDVQNGNIICTLDFKLTGFTAENDNPKDHRCNEEDSSNWVYWKYVTGTITETNGSVITIEGTGNLSQMGEGANPTETEQGKKGLSFWFKTDSHDYPNGDINISFECK